MGYTGLELAVEFESELRALKGEGFGRRKIAEHLSEKLGATVSPGTVGVALVRLGLHGAQKVQHQIKVVVEEEDDDSDMDAVEDLVASRVKAARSKRSKADRHTKVIRLEPEPFGLMVFGDPHVDNEGCDWSSLYDHVQLAQNTPGILAACVGDMTDNWIGRLARLYSKSSVTAQEGWRLSEWFLSQMQWIAIVGGNHDAWAHGAGVDPMEWLTEKCGVKCYAPDELRITFHWTDPSLEPVVWILRHDFGGRSWFHPTHGPHKEAMLDGRCHILTAGHIHQWGALTTEQRHSRVTHAMRVRGYKRQDDYAREKGFYEQAFGEAVLIVINPTAPDPGRIQPFWDLEAGCKYLTWLREQHKKA